MARFGGCSNPLLIRHIGLNNVDDSYYLIAYSPHLRLCSYIHDYGRPKMKLNPLAVFTGLTLATFGALVYVERNTGSEEALTATTKVEPLAVPEPKP